MKKTIITILGAMLCTAAATAASPEKADTVMSVDSPDRVTITESPDGVSIIVNGLKGDSTFVASHSRRFDAPTRVNAKSWHAPIPLSRSRSGWEFTIGGPGIGWTMAVGQPDGTGIEMGKSLEISWLNMVALAYRMPWQSSALSFGFGLDWRNYRNSTSASCFVPVDGRVEIGSYADGVSGTSSRLKVFSLGIPVLWKQKLPFRMLGTQATLSLGAVFCYNSHASLRTCWTEPDGTKAVRTSNRIGQRRFSIDLIGLFTIAGPMSAYVRYSPNSVLRGPLQPHFRPFSTGLIFFY